MKKLNCLLVLIMLSIMLSAQEIPQKISYQGKLLDSGVPVNGTKNITFTIGSWTETQSVQISEGLYSVTLGSVTPIPSSLFDDNSSLELEIEVDGTTLEPHTEILSSPYAFKAENAVDTEKLNGQDSSYYLNWNTLNNIPSDIADGDDVDDADPDPTNELQTLSQSGTNVTLSDGGGTVSIADNDNNSSNECQSLSLSGSTLTLTGSGCSNSNVTLPPGSSYWSQTGNNIYYNSGKVFVGTTSSSGSLSLEVDNNYNNGAAIGAYDNTNSSGAAIFAYSNSFAAIQGNGNDANYAGYFMGDVHITGNLSGGKSSSPQTIITIDHPIEQENKVLNHSALYSPEMTTVYKGRAMLQNGKIIIELPSYFEALNHPDNREINLTSINGWSPLYLDGEIANNQFIVKTTDQGDPNQEFSWVVYAVRNDQWAQDHPLVVEEEKGVGNRFVKGKMIYEKDKDYLIK